MVKFKLTFSENADKQLAKLDKFQRKIIISWLIKNLDGSTNPRQHGKALSGQYSSYWRYRIGDYRIIADILDDEVVVTVLKVGHRSKIYN